MNLNKKQTMEEIRKGWRFAAQNSEHGKHLMSTTIDVSSEDLRRVRTSRRRAWNFGTKMFNEEINQSWRKPAR